MKLSNLIAASLLLIVSTCSARAAEMPLRDVQLTDVQTLTIAGSPSAADQLAALRAETKALRDKLKEARAASKLSKAIKARDKARADLLKIGGVL